MRAAGPPAAGAAPGVRLRRLFAKLGGTDGRIAAERLAVVVAHPDDETIGVGGQLARLDGVLIVHLTNGSPADPSDAQAHGFATQAAYAAARRAEFARAMAEGAARSGATLCFEVDDQDLARHLVEVARRLAAVFVEYRTEMVLTHPYEGGHPDHDAASFAVHAAATLIARSRGQSPAIGEMAFYHGGAEGVVTQRFPENPPAAEFAVVLDDAAWHRKQQMLAAFVTQGGTLAAFNGRTERFRAAPFYDFTAPPNGGRVHYESFLSWRGPQWTEAARAALAELESTSSACG